MQELFNDLFEIRVIKERPIDYPAAPNPLPCDGHIWIPFIKDFVRGMPDNANTYLRVFCYKCQSLGEITGVKEGRESRDAFED